MEVLLVRHAHAGSKVGWTDDDRDRPLSERGRAEASAVAEALGGMEPSRIVSSPYLRCRQTVQPLADRLAVALEESDSLVPDAGSAAVSLVRSLLGGPDQGPVVLCTHGETIETMQRRLGRSGRHSFGPGSPHEKGSTWILRARGGRVVDARYLPPSRDRSANDSVQSGANCPR